MSQPHNGSIGAMRVRENFNPGGHEQVNYIKRHTADLIDYAVKIREANDTGEVARCCALAMTAYEEAAMWLVKAATTGK